MREKKISFSVNDTLEWKDFGFPDKTFDWGKDSENIQRHMAKCSPLFHGVNDSRLYYCHIAWSVEKAGIFENAKDDYIELEQLDSDKVEVKRRLSEFSMGKWDKGYLDFCRFCGGCGEDNQHYVSVGRQAERTFADGRQE